MADPVPDWLVERLAVGDLPPATARDVRARLEARGEQQRIPALASANRAFLDAHPVEHATREIERRARTRPARWRSAHLAVPLALGAAALSIWLVVRPTAGPAREDVRLKGLRPHLVIYKKTAAGSERLPDHGRVRYGDTIQLAYVSAGKRFGVIASIDARNIVTLHLPEDGGTAASLRADGETPLAHAFALDDTPGFERFVFVAADSAFASAVVVDALRDARPLPADVTTIELTLEKEP